MAEIPVGALLQLVVKSASAIYTTLERQSEERKSFTKLRGRALSQIFTILKYGAELQPVLEKNLAVGSQVIEELQDIQKELTKIAHTLEEIPDKTGKMPWTHSTARKELEGVLQDLTNCTADFGLLLKVVKLFLEVNAVEHLRIANEKKPQEPASLLTSDSTDQAGLDVQVRCLGYPSALTLSYHLQHDSIGADLVFILVDLELATEPIRLFQALNGRHERTSSGRLWAKFNKEYPIREVALCPQGQRRIEYTHRNDVALLLVQGDTVPEHVMLISMPLVSANKSLEMLISENLGFEVEVNGIWDVVKGVSLEAPDAVRELEMKRNISHLVVTFIRRDVPAAS